MNRLLSTALVAAAIGAGGFLVGCEETTSRETQTKVKDDGTVIRKEEKVTEGADGTVTRTETKKVDKPDNDRDGASIKVDVDKKD
jgi:hypothetical protein